MLTTTVYVCQYMLSTLLCRYGATLFAVEKGGEIRINPGNDVKIEPDDTLFYICLTQEEDAAIVEKGCDKKPHIAKSLNSFSSTVDASKKKITKLFLKFAVSVDASCIFLNKKLSKLLL